MIIVSVRGSEIPFISMDWRNNAKFIQYTNKRVTEYCEGAGIHGGFFQSALRIGNTKLNSLENTSIYTKIEELQKNTNRDLYFTGHSLGGAIAEILAFFSAYETNMDITAVYTYGEPKNGNLAYRDCHDKVLRDKTFRFINNRDIVARVRGSGEYSHVGNLAYFDRNGNLSDINTYSSYLGITGDVLLLRFAFDHKLANYIELLEKNINVQPYSSQPNKLSKGTP
jgi:triacylglycerol lipase